MNDQWLDDEVDGALKRLRARHPTRRGPYIITDEQLDKMIAERESR